MKLHCPGSVTSGQQFFELSDLVISDAAEYVGQPGLQIDAVQLGAELEWAL